MLSSATFWDEEGSAPLLTLEGGFLRANLEAVRARVAAWPALAGLDAEPAVPLVPADFSDHSYIVKRDAERTFFGEAQRRMHMQVLTTLTNELKDYGQGMSYAAALLLLFFEPALVAKFLLKLARDPKYVPGYWCAEAVRFNVDARVFGRMLSGFFPDVSAHLAAKGVAPQTFCQKWFVGLGLHVLHYEGLLAFWERFLVEGYEFLFKFALAMLVATREPLMACKAASDMYALLRLDGADAATSVAIVKEAIELAVDDQFAATVVSLRADVYDNEVKPALDAAAKFNAEHAADAEEASNSDDDADADPDCEACNNLVPERYCAICDLLLCQRCQDAVARGALKSKPQHTAEHATTSANVRKVVAARAAKSAEAVDALAASLGGLAVAEPAGEPAAPAAAAVQV